MTDAVDDRGGVRVVRVDDSNWRTYRDVRLAMLQDAPRAFWTTYAEAAARSDEEWRAMVGRSHTWLAVDDVRPLGSVAADPAERIYRFLPAEGDGLHQIPVGPVHASIIEPGHFRLAVNGETVVRLEERLGYTHKGIEQLMAGATVSAAARLASRASGDSTVAYSLAFARAVEAALEIEAPPRARHRWRRPRFSHRDAPGSRRRRCPNFAAPPR